MSVVAGLLAAGIVCMYFAHQANVTRLLEQHEVERERNDMAIGALLDRIQHPEVRQVQPGEPVEHTPPADAAELAMVGLEVPDFVHVGNQE